MLNTLKQYVSVGQFCFALMLFPLSCKQREVKKEKNWLTINDHFFNANPSLNLKLCKLLKKLRGWRQAPTVAA